MKRKLSHPCVVLALAACAVAAAPAVASASPLAAARGAAGPVQDTRSRLSRTSSSPAMSMDRPGPGDHLHRLLRPITPGETGHPLGDQTIEAAANGTVSAADLGYTGTQAHSIVATLGPSAASNSIIANFTSYYVIDYIPTTMTVPLWFSASWLTPLPASSTSSSANLYVTFESGP